MAVTKRTRFEVLRRDDHTCRYCRSTENALTVDHVVPVSLGGSDSPDNLVAACKDCNAGKSSSGADQVTIGQVADDAVRWSKAMSAAAALARKKRSDDREFAVKWLEVWNWLGGSDDLPIDWEASILAQRDAGLDAGDLVYATKTTLEKAWVPRDSFRYFMGVCATMLSQRAEVARQLLTNGEAR